MGISNVAVKTFDSTGSQSLCRTNEYKGDEEVKSSFISKCQKLYISGSGETVIPGSLRTFPKLDSVDTFYVNSDTDAISDMIFNIEFRFKNPATSTITQTLIASVTKDIVLSIIDRVEIKLGSLTVQTLTADDIFIRNLTELGVPYNFNSTIGQLPNSEGGGTELLELTGHWTNLLDSDPNQHTDVHVIQASCSLPFMGRNKDMSRALLQAGALTNAVTVKVYYNELYRNLTSAGGSSYQVITGGRYVSPFGFTDGGTNHDYLDLGYFKSHLKVRTHIISDTEKKFIHKNIIHKVLNTSSSVTKTIPINVNVPRFTDNTTQIEVDLENVSHNVSHLLIAVRLPHVHNKRFAGNKNFNDLPMSSTIVSRITNSVNGVSTPFSTIDPRTSKLTGDLFGYLRNPIDSMELVLGSDRTGFIKGSSAQLDTCENFDLKYAGNHKAFYMITLAEKAFDTSGVAFSKINNKKLIINLYDNIFSQLYTDNSLNSNDYQQSGIITVTACGTKVQSVVGGSMSFL